MTELDEESWRSRGGRVGVDASSAGADDGEGGSSGEALEDELFSAASSARTSELTASSAVGATPVCAGATAVGEDGASSSLSEKSMSMWSASWSMLNTDMSNSGCATRLIRSPAGSCGGVSAARSSGMSTTRLARALMFDLDTGVPLGRAPSSIGRGSPR